MNPNAEPKTEPKLEPNKLEQSIAPFPADKLSLKPEYTECLSCRFKGTSRTAKDGSAIGSFANGCCSWIMMCGSGVPQSYGKRDAFHYCTNCGEKIGKGSGLINSGMSGAGAPVLAPSAL